MNYKKLSKYLFLLLLTFGAALILGFLSFGGIFALWPIMSLAVAAFALSVGYESEIYFQNIKNAFKKLFKDNYLQRETAKALLLEHFKDAPDEGYFKTYKDLLLECHEYEHVTLSDLDKIRYKKIKQELSDLEQWLAYQLFKKTSNKTKDPFKLAVRKWFEDKRAETLKRHHIKARRYTQAKIFSVFANFFMGLSTSYLLIENCVAFPVIIATIPFAFWPLFIIPLSIISGLGYGFLIFNTITDMINNDTINYWHQRLKAAFKDKNKSLFIKGFMAVTVISLLALAIALTLCTAGTWWTVITHSRPLFNFMSNISSLVMNLIGVLNMFFIAGASLAFNIENTSHTLAQFFDLIDNGKNTFILLGRLFRKNISDLVHSEHPLQLLNPFRLFLTLTFLPLRVIFFVGHLLSIGASGDRVPFVPAALAFVFGFVPEFFEDFDYFLPLHDLFEHHDHSNPDAFLQGLLKSRLGGGHGHQHGNDIPTKLLTLVFYPVFTLSALWDASFSLLNPRQKPLPHKHHDCHDHHHAVKVRLSFTEALNKQLGKPPMKAVSKHNETPVSEDWQKMRAVFKLKQGEAKHGKVYKALRDELKKPDADVNDVFQQKGCAFFGKQAKYVGSVRSRVSRCA